MQAGAADGAKHRPGQIASDQDNQDNGPQRQQRLAPGRKVHDQADIRRRRVSPFGQERTARHRHFARACADGQKRHQGQHRDHGDVLEEQNRKGRLAALTAQPALFAERLQHDGGRGERQDHAQGDGHPPVHTQGETAGQGQARHRDLHAAQPDQPDPHVPEQAWLQFQSDQEHHDDDTEFSKMLHVLGVRADQFEQGRDRDPRQQIAQHRAEPEPVRDQHSDDAGPEIDSRLQQK